MIAASMIEDTAAADGSAVQEDVPTTENSNQQEVDDVIFSTYDLS